MSAIVVLILPTKCGSRFYKKEKINYVSVFANVYVSCEFKAKKGGKPVKAFRPILISNDFVITRHGNHIHS
jgi:hypothetical protein